MLDDLADALHTGARQHAERVAVEIDQSLGNDELVAKAPQRIGQILGDQRFARELLHLEISKFNAGIENLAAVR